MKNILLAMLLAIFSNVTTASPWEDTGEKGSWHWEGPGAVTYSKMITYGTYPNTISFFTKERTQKEWDIRLRKYVPDDGNREYLTMGDDRVAAYIRFDPEKNCNICCVALNGWAHVNFIYEKFISPDVFLDLARIKLNPEKDETPGWNLVWKMDHYPMSIENPESGEGDWFSILRFEPHGTYIVDRLKMARTLTVSTGKGDDLIRYYFDLEGSSTALNKARSNCRKIVKGNIPHPL